MIRVGLLSDTHGYWDSSLELFFKDCHEIWHAGDIGDTSVVKRISTFKPFKGVYGNIDDQDVRKECSKYLRFNCEKVDVLITHIGGTPSRYDPSILSIINQNPPNLFICGHSHILKVMFDKKRNFLYMNPGAAGVIGFHKYRTAIRFAIEGENIKDLEVWEAPRSRTIYPKD